MIGFSHNPPSSIHPKNPSRSLVIFEVDLKVTFEFRVKVEVKDEVKLLAQMCRVGGGREMIIKLISTQIDVEVKVGG